MVLVSYQESGIQGGVITSLERKQRAHSGRVHKKTDRDLPARFLFYGFPALISGFWAISLDAGFSGF